MEANSFSIVEYKTSDAPQLLRLLLELHDTYFHKNASKQIQEIGKEKDIRKSYEDYINLINESNDGNWKILLATSSENKIIGFIIGSIEKDEYLVNGAIGKFEDWYMEEQYRGKGIGIKLYNELEKWFKEKGFKQVMSDTWDGNELSIKAHKKLGFFVSGVMFGKKLE
jgi:RimJ/RimL family protein N-acetyltransferase